MTRGLGHPSERCRDGFGKEGDHEDDSTETNELLSDGVHRRRASHANAVYERSFGSSLLFIILTDDFNLVRESLKDGFLETLAGEEAASSDCEVEPADLVVPVGESNKEDEYHETGQEELELMRASEGGAGREDRREVGREGRRAARVNRLGAGSGRCEAV